MNKKRTQKYRQCVFQPHFPEKYKGTFPILLRSSWEISVAKILDHNPNILSWGSESIVIPYKNPLTGRISRYFIDFNMTMRDKEGNLKKFLIEIKPHAQTIPPTQTKNTRSLQRRQGEYIKNQKKWEAARSFAAKHGSNFVVLTEKHLGF
jgi:hypothetical protein